MAYRAVIKHRTDEEPRENFRPALRPRAERECRGQSAAGAFTSDGYPTCVNIERFGVCLQPAQCSIDIVHRTWPVRREQAVQSNNCHA
jgi:hypothetical protein